MKTNKKSTTVFRYVLFAILTISTMLFIAYIISPVDFIPAFATAFIGIIDDIIALVGALSTMAGAVTALVCAIKGQKKQDIIVAC